MQLTNIHTHSHSTHLKTTFHTNHSQKHYLVGTVDLVETTPKFQHQFFQRIFNIFLMSKNILKFLCWFNIKLMLNRCWMLNIKVLWHFATLFWLTTHLPTININKHKLLSIKQHNECTNKGNMVFQNLVL